MSLSGFKRLLSHYCEGSCKVGLVGLVAILAASSTGCNLTVHRVDGFGKRQLGPPGVTQPLAAEVLADTTERAQPEEPVSSEIADGPVPQEGAEVAQFEAEQGTVETKIAPDIKKPALNSEDSPDSSQVTEGRPSQEVSAPIGKAVHVLGKPSEAPGVEPRAILASLKIPGGAKLSPLPPPIEDGEGAVPVLPVENPSPQPNGAIAEPDPVSGRVELTSAVNAAESPPQEDKKSEGTGEEKKPEDKPSGTGEGESPGDDKAAADGAAGNEAADDAAEKDSEDGSQFPYGIVIVLVVCLGIAIFQNTAGKSI